MSIKDLEIKKEEIEKINSLAKIHCKDDEDMLDDYDLMPGEILYPHDIGLENGYSIEFKVTIDEYAVYMDFILYYNNSEEIYRDDTLEKLCDGDIIDFYVEDDVYGVRIKVID